MHWYLDVLKKYVVFDGRAARMEYWMFTLINFIIFIVLSVVSSIVPILGILTLLYWLAIILPSIAVSVRRLHDIGRSGWWLLLVLTGIGAIVILVFHIMDSQQGSNDYGSNPKGA